MATSPSSAFVPPPLSTRQLRGAATAATAPSVIGGSSFTPGHGAAAATPTAAAHPSRPRMTAPSGTPSAAAVAWAAAALRAAGGVDPSTHHVAAVLRRSRGEDVAIVAAAAAIVEPAALESPAAPTAAAVVDVGPSAAVLAWVAAQSPPAAVAAPAPTVVTAAHPAGGGEWACRQASLSCHVAARWKASASAAESTRSPVPATTPEAATPICATGSKSPLDAATSLQSSSGTAFPAVNAAMDSPSPSSDRLSPRTGDSTLGAAAARLTPGPSGTPPVEAPAEVGPPPPSADCLVDLLSPPLPPSPLTEAAARLGTAASIEEAMEAPTNVKSLPYPAVPASPVDEAANRLGSSESYTPPPPTPPSVAPSVEEEKPKTLGEYLAAPVGSSPLESAAAVLARSARLAPTGKAAMEVPPPLAELLDAPPSPDSPLEHMAAGLIPPEPEAPPSEPIYPPEAYVDWNKAPPAAATPLESAANMLERAARLDPSGKAAMEVPPPLAELLDAPPAESPLQQMARRLVEDAASAAATAAAAAGDEGSEEAEEEAVGAEEAVSGPSASAEAMADPKASLMTSPPADSLLGAAAAVLSRSVRLAPMGKAAMEVAPPLATLLCPPLAASPLSDAAAGMAAHDKVKVKEAVEASPRRLDVSTTTRSPVLPPLVSPEEVKELLTTPPARSPLTMAADRLISPAPVGVSSSELEGAARSAAPREARAKRSTGAPVMAATPAALPSFMAATLTGTAETPASTGTAEPAAADAAKDGPASVRDGWRAAVPPAVTLAFVGACLALSQAAGAVMDAGLPLH